MPEATIPPATTTTTTGKTLLLLTGKSVTDPTFVELVTSIFQKDNNEIHRQVLDRVVEGAISLPTSSFSNIYYIPNSESEHDAIFSTPKVLDSLFKALAPQGLLSTVSISETTVPNTTKSNQSNSTTPIVTPSMITAAIMAGLLQSPDKSGFIKPQESIPSSATTLLRRPNKNGTAASAAPLKKMPLIFKRKTDSNNNTTTPALSSSTTTPIKQTNTNLNLNSVSIKRPAQEPSSGIVQISLFDGLDDDDGDYDDDLLDENTLVNDLAFTTLSKPITLPAKCDPGPGKKRRKACKDCTCGLRELELEEEEAQREKQTAVILNFDQDDEYAIDFTVPGKTGGSCGSCALGDAFRCDGCPYLGLPPFKPGEIINISAIKNDA